jgi:uncharacterized protein (DUF1697 family)
MTKAKNLEPADGQIRYVAFLRGINVGGHRLIKMDELGRLFTAMGLSDVRTVIASGNVLFASEEADAKKLTARIELALEESLGYRVDVMLRTMARLRDLIELDPVQPKKGEGHLYVTFLPDVPATVPPLPAHFPDEYFSVLAVSEAEVLVSATKMPNGLHGDPGKYLKKHFGKVTTTRNWNTVVKIAGM